MTRTGIVAAIAASVALSAMPAAAKSKPIDSWGRVGVDFETYRTDARECALQGHYADVSETEQAKKFVRATKRLENSDDTSMGPAMATSAADNAPPPDTMYRTTVIAARTEQIRASIRPDKLVGELHEGMVGVVESCLLDRGYSQFRLTESQSKALSKLEKGSDERRHFLHALAADPAVLENQGLPIDG
jgi:hypothetical protein